MTKSDTDQPTGRFYLIRRYFREYRYYLIWGGLFLLLTNAFNLVSPYILNTIFNLLEAKPLESATLADFLNWVDAGTMMGQILALLLLMIALTVIAGIFRFMVRRTIIWMSRIVEYRLRGDLVQHLLKLPSSFYHSNRTGDIMARATNDLEAVRMMVGPAVMHSANTVIGLIIALGFMISLSPQLTLYALLPMLFFPYLVNKLGNLIHRKFIKIQAKFSDMNATAQENLSGVRVVRAYRQENAEYDNFAEVSSDYVGLNLGMAKLQGFFFPTIHFLAGSISLIVLYVGGRLAIGGDISLGTIVAFFAYTQMMFWPLFAMGWVVSLYQRGTASLDRINKILQTEPEVRDERSDLPMRRIKGHVRFNGLTFAFNGRPVLSNIDLEISPGQTVGIMGATGSGKTALVSLLARMYPIPRDTIKIDNIDINDWRLSDLRRHIGFATQEPFLFSETIADNIRFGIPDAGKENVEQAAAAAALSKDVEAFKAGFDTIVGERGITLSGGQKQRTAIARALMVDPSILILDDATSSVDTETENEIHQRVHHADHDCTTLIISHRVSSVKEADFIVYLEDGKIVERGTHDELVARNEHYARLYRAQLLEMELEQL